MLEHDEKYRYMLGLNKLQRFLLATQYDMSRRNWFGRRIDQGFIAVSPHTYSPGMLIELVRYCLTLDRDEVVASQRAGLRRPRFQLIDTKRLFAIDALLSQQGIIRPFQVLECYRDIYVNGGRCDIPTIETFPPVKIIKPRYLKIGDVSDGMLYRYDGLGDSYYMGMTEEGCWGTRRLKSGEKILNVSTGPEFDIDEEAASFLLDYELDELIERGKNKAAWTAEGYLYYVQLGMLTISESQLSRVNYMIKRTLYKEESGINALDDPSLIYPYCQDLPPELVKAGKAVKEADLQMSLL